jgi:pyruvate dehydrogenase E1 component
MNENYTHPGLADVADKNAEAGILHGMYLLKEAGGKPKLKVQLMGSGTILREVIAAAEVLEQDWGVGADIWSCPSFTELRREGLDADRWNMLHPGEPRRKSYVESRLAGRGGPVIASTDYMKAFADQIRPFIPAGMRYRVLGTDGYGRSDTREKLRHFFEVNRYWVAIAALTALAEDGAVKPALVAEAIRKYGIDPNKPNPVTV